MIVALENCRPFFGLDFDRHDFSGEESRIKRSLRRLLRTQGVAILIFARNLELAGEIFSGPGHRRVAIGVEQGDHQAVFQLALAQG